MNVYIHTDKTRKHWVANRLFSRQTVSQTLKPPVMGPLIVGRQKYTDCEAANLSLAVTLLSHVLSGGNRDRPQSPPLNGPVSTTFAHLGNYACNRCTSPSTRKPTRSTHYKRAQAVECSFFGILEISPLAAPGLTLRSWGWAKLHPSRDDLTRVDGWCLSLFVGPLMTGKLSWVSPCLCPNQSAQASDPLRHWVLQGSDRKWKVWRLDLYRDRWHFHLLVYFVNIIWNTKL